jgi:hypothetical protein
VNLNRGIGSTLLTELAKPVFHPVTLVNLDWPSGEVWFHGGRGNITWSSETWAGVGDFAAIKAPEEAVGLVPGECVLTIIGTLSALLDVLDANVKNRRAAIYFGCVTTRAGNTLVGTPFEAFAGYMDGTIMPYGEGDGGNVTYALDLYLSSGPGARIGASITHSFEDQKAAYPTDTAGRHTQFAVPGIRSITWPE